MQNVHTEMCVWWPDPEHRKRRTHLAKIEGWVAVGFIPIIRDYIIGFDNNSTSNNLKRKSKKMNVCRMCRIRQKQFVNTMTHVLVKSMY